MHRYLETLWPTYAPLRGKRFCARVHWCSVERAAFRRVSLQRSALRHKLEVLMIDNDGCLVNSICLAHSKCALDFVR
jgi:hypothetical protein